MPAGNQQDRAGSDFRPAGAVAGAALPTASLLEYLLHSLPKYHKKLKDAPDWTLANGDLDVARAMRELKPGDFGLSGLQNTDPAINFLVHGSASASGGPGAHGQIVGANLQTPHTIARMPESARTPDLPFLMNNRGELYSPQYAKNYAKLHDIRKRYAEWQAYREATTAGKKVPKPAGKPVSKSELSFFRQFMTADETGPSSHMVATDYGKKKETLRGRSRELQRLKAQQQAWKDFDAGKTTVKPAVPRPDPAKLEALSTANQRTARGFKKFFRSPHLEAFFGGDPQSAAAGVEKQVRELADQMSGKASEKATAAAKKLYDLAATMEKRPGGKALADSIRSTAAQALERAQNPGAAAPARSKLFRPRQFETFIPTLHHGGTMGTADDPLMHAISNASDAVKDEIKNRTGIGVRSLGRRLAENAKELAADRAYAQKNPWAMYRPQYGRPDAKSVLADGPGVTDSVFGAVAADGSRLRPAEMPGVAAYGPGGPRSTVWMRFTDGVNPERLHKSLVGQIGQSYDSTGATLHAGAGEVLGANTLQRWLHKLTGFKPGKGVCWGNHCGSMPAKVFAETGNIVPKISPRQVLPATLALDDGVKIIGVQNKTRAMADLFRKTVPKRLALGLGAAAGLGSAGYGLVGAGQSLFRGKAPAPVPMPAPVAVAPPSRLPKSVLALGKYGLPAAALGGLGLGLAGMYAVGRARNKGKKKPDDEFQGVPELAPA